MFGDEVDSFDASTVFALEWRESFLTGLSTPFCSSSSYLSEHSSFFFRSHPHEYYRDHAITEIVLCDPRSQRSRTILAHSDSPRTQIHLEQTCIFPIERIRTDMAEFRSQSSPTMPAQESGSPGPLDNDASPNVELNDNSVASPCSSIKSSSISISSAVSDEDHCPICYTPSAIHLARRSSVAAGCANSGLGTVRTPCGHDFCVECLGEEIKRRVMMMDKPLCNLPCPYCRQNMLCDEKFPGALLNERFVLSILFGVGMLVPDPVFGMRIRAPERKFGPRAREGAFLSALVPMVIRDGRLDLLTMICNSVIETAPMETALFNAIDRGQTEVVQAFLKSETGSVSCWRADAMINVFFGFLFGKHLCVCSRVNWCAAAVCLLDVVCEQVIVHFCRESNPSS